MEHEALNNPHTSSVWRWLACLFAHLLRPCTFLEETMQPSFQGSSVLQKGTEFSVDVLCCQFRHDHSEVSPPAGFEPKNLPCG